MGYWLQHPSPTRSRQAHDQCPRLPHTPAKPTHAPCPQGLSLGAGAPQATGEATTRRSIAHKVCPYCRHSEGHPTDRPTSGRPVLPDRRPPTPGGNADSAEPVRREGNEHTSHPFDRPPCPQGLSLPADASVDGHAVHKACSGWHLTHPHAPLTRSVLAGNSRLSLPRPLLHS